MLYVAEDQVTGSAKVLYRNDREKAPLKLGFSFAAHHRPAAEAGSGDDFTITVDDRRGVHLRDLWQELEQRETAAWTAAGEARPNWAPRDRVLGRLQPALVHQSVGDADRGTRLVKHAKDDEAVVPGSKLGWADIKAAIWATYNPLRSIQVEARDGTLVPILEFAPESVSRTRNGPARAMAIRQHGDECDRTPVPGQRADHGADTGSHGRPHVMHGGA